MNDRAIIEGAPRVRMHMTEAGRCRIMLDGAPLGPVMTLRAAKVVRRWLEEGALAELEGEGGSKLQTTLGKVDQAWDAVNDLLKNGLR